MGYNPYYCILCGDCEDDGWGNKVGYIFMEILKAKGYEINDEDDEDICPDCLKNIIKDIINKTDNTDNSDNSNKTE